jgi:hypothetical protein
MRGRKHVGGDGAQAASRERPLRRRPARIARPARVRIRRRKPCVLCRRRLFGWKVRLLTEDSEIVVVERLRSTGAGWLGGPGRGQSAPVGASPTSPRYGVPAEGVKPPGARCRPGSQRTAPPLWTTAC